MDDAIEFRVWINSSDNTVRLEAIGFENADDALAFADWLTAIQMDYTEEVVVH